jgi:hypothetical protein
MQTVKGGLIILGLFLLVTILMVLDPLNLNPNGLNGQSRFELSGTTTQNYIITLLQSEYGTIAYGKVPISDNKIGLRFEEGIFGIQSVSGTVDYPLTIKIEIYE